MVIAQRTITGSVELIVGDGNKVKVVVTFGEGATFGEMSQLC
jgi:hypothetical protein